MQLAGLPGAAARSGFAAPSLLAPEPTPLGRLRRTPRGPLARASKSDDDAAKGAADGPSAPVGFKILPELLRQEKGVGVVFTVALASAASLATKVRCEAVHN